MSLENTHYGYEYISSIIKNEKKNIFFLGIGGVSMSSLAIVCAERGHTVSGYDRTETRLTRKMADKGIKIFYSSHAENVKDTDLLVYTVAMPESDPSLVYCKENGIPVISRADFLGYIMMGYKERIGIAGMHGKSTTTAIVAHIFETAGMCPTVFDGAEMKNYSSMNVMGNNDVFIFEACEYMDSFLDFYPSIAVILNIEMDHVDYFHSMEQIISSFAAFMSKADTVVANADDEETMIASERSGKETITFSKESNAGRFTSRNVEYDHGRAKFDVYKDGEYYGHVDTHVPGHYIVQDTLAAIAAADKCGISADIVEKALMSFEGINRRLDYKGKSKSGTEIYDDYAHHPTEIETTLKTFSEFGYDKTLAVFQSHTFSRTYELLDDFASSLATTGMDEVILAPIYPAREVNTYGVTPEMLRDRILSHNTETKCICMESFDEIMEYIEKNYGEYDGAIIVGAGDIYKVSENLVKNPCLE